MAFVVFDARFRPADVTMFGLTKQPTVGEEVCVDRDQLFVELFRAHHTAIVRFIERRVSNPETAADIAMDCFEIAWTKLDPANPPGLPWLYQVARHRIGNEYRRRDRDGSLLERIRREIQVHVPEPLRESAIEVVQAVAQLPPKDREIVWLTYWEGLSAEEVAEVMRMTAGAVRVHLTRVRVKLRPLVDDPAVMFVRGSDE